MTTYAIANNHGQIRFLSEADAWVLAPNRAIRVFNSRRKADAFLKQNHALAAFKAETPVILTFLPNARAGNR
jgi:hypothetical protein